MIGLNEELKLREAQGKPVRIGLIGTGQMGTDIVAEGFCCSRIAGEIL